MSGNRNALSGRLALMTAAAAFLGPDLRPITDRTALSPPDDWDGEVWWDDAP